MQRYRLFAVGMLMIAAGGHLIFAMPSSLPLWFVWLVGPLLWYVGIVLGITGLAVALFLPRDEARHAVMVRKKKESISVLRFSALALCKCGPAGVTQEIPSMGGFIL